jgi:hypothetical protein
MKISLKSAAKAVFRTFLGDPKPTSDIKCIVPAFFGDRFVGKEVGLYTYKTYSEELGDRRDFVLIGSELPA